MADYVDFLSIYVGGSAQMLVGFYFFTVFLKKKEKPYLYILLAVFANVVTELISAGGIFDFFIYALFLTVYGIWLCRADPKSAVLYAALTVEIMQLSYGIVNSLLSILYPHLHSLDPIFVGNAFMLAGNAAALLLAALCYRVAYRYFSFYETIRKQYVFTALTPIFLLFLMDEYISSLFYTSAGVSEDGGITIYTNHFQMLVIQVLGMASLFCILFAYKRLLWNFHLSTELSLLEQEESSLSQYVEEARARYEKTKAFRHDIKNHITVVKSLLENGEADQALAYIGDMADMSEELSFPCGTGNPVADILIGNKLGIAKSMGIEVDCSLFLPYPCPIRDIDFCIILSNALDNAVCACRDVCDGAEKYIRVTGRIQGDIVLLEVENSFHGKRLPERGTGLSNMKAVAEKYQGAVSIKTQDNSFLLSVLLVIPRHTEDILRQIG